MCGNRAGQARNGRLNRVVGIAGDRAPAFEQRNEGARVGDERVDVVRARAQLGGGVGAGDVRGVEQRGDRARQHAVALRAFGQRDRERIGCGVDRVGDRRGGFLGLRYRCKRFFRG